MTEKLRHKADASQPHTLPSPTSQRSIQSLSKSVSTPTHGQKKKKHGHTTWYIKNWADSGKFQVSSSHQTFGFGGQLIAPKCPTFHIPEPLGLIQYKMRIIVAIYLISSSLTVFGQKEPQFTLFDNNFSLFNPGETGIKAKYNAAISHRNQWVGLENNPITTTANFNMQLDQVNSGLGIAFMRDALGAFTANRAYLNYSYHLKLRDGLTLGLGTGVFFNNRVLDFDTVTYSDYKINFNSGVYL